MVREEERPRCFFEMRTHTPQWRRSRRARSYLHSRRANRGSRCSDTGISMFTRLSATPGSEQTLPREAPARRVGHRSPFFRRHLIGLLCGAGMEPPRGRGRPSGAWESQLFFGYIPSSDPTYKLLWKYPAYKLVWNFGSIYPNTVVLDHLTPSMSCLCWQHIKKFILGTGIKCYLPRRGNILK